MTRRTPLYERHAAAGARFVDFGGWQMPVQYSGIGAEHAMVRASAGIFDVSHMGEVVVTGTGALAALNRLIGNDLAQIADGQALYTPMCNESGGIVDDLVVYRFSPERFLICCNASNRAKDFAWICDHIEGATATDAGDSYSQLALQGPKSVEILRELTSTDLDAIGRYWFVEGQIAGAGAVISRTGYTGEDGFELYLAPEAGPVVWDALFEVAGERACPVGLGARDTLRLEMKYCLYGQDIDETTTPLEAGLGWAIKLDRDDFIGRAALLRQNAEGVKRQLIGFRMDSRAPARHGYPVVDEVGATIGQVTSGTRSPSTGENIGLAYVPAPLRRPGTPIRIQIRGRIETAKVVRTPFVPK